MLEGREPFTRHLRHAAPRVRSGMYSVFVRAIYISGSQKQPTKTVCCTVQTSLRPVELGTCWVRSGSAISIH